MAWSDGEKPYDGTIITPNLVVSNYVPSNPAVVTWNGSPSADSAYYQSVAVLDPTSAIYYELPDNTIYNLYISPVPVNIVWAPTSKDYDGTILESIPTITNLATGDVCTMTYIDNIIGPDIEAKIAQVTSLSNPNYTLDGSTGKDQLIIIRDKLDPEHGRVYEYDPSRTGEGTAPYNHWIRVL